MVGNISVIASSIIFIFCLRLGWVIGFDMRAFASVQFVDVGGFCIFSAGFFTYLSLFMFFVLSLLRNSMFLVVFEGTTKRKELHGTTQTRALSGTWGEKLDGTIFQAYKIDFSCNIVDELYSGFVLLVESKLDDDVGNIEMDLYLISKFVKACVSSCGQVCLDSEQVHLYIHNFIYVLL